MSEEAREADGLEHIASFSHSHATHSPGGLASGLLAKHSRSNTPSLQIQEGRCAPSRCFQQLAQTLLLKKLVLETCPEKTPET